MEQACHTEHGIVWVKRHLHLLLKVEPLEQVLAMETTKLGEHKEASYCHLIQPTETTNKIM